MPNHGKGGRKPERDEVKRAAVAVRTTPAIKAALTEAAEEAGRSVTQEIETRLEASLAMDKPKRTGETMQLLSQLAADIARAEEMTGKRWHKDLKTWAMVREALASGEIERQCPENDRFFSDTEGETAELRQRIAKLTAELDYDARTLADIGFPVSAHQPFPLLGAKYLTGPLQDYAAERERVEQSDHEPALKQVALKIIDRMEATDRERAEAQEEYNLTMRWMMEAIQEGVSLWDQEVRERYGAIPREYRPSAGLTPPRSPYPAGMFGTALRPTA